MKKKVFVGMSGGVDSSVAAALLKEQGYDVFGVHLKCFNVDGCAAQDAEDARRAAETIKIPFYVLDLEKEYKKKVVEYMVEGYRRGITPNPDVMCNKEIKFGLFLEKALKMGADFVATGHYVVSIIKHHVSGGKKESRRQNLSILHSTFPISLSIAKDKNKDQSYFLWTLTQEQLSRCLFPLGDIEKPEVRRLAKKYNLPNAEKKDSQGICFLGKVGLEDFLKKYLPEKKGIVLDTSGKIVGEHSGAHFYTIGQRHGLNLGKHSKTGGEIRSKPFYVAEKDIESNAILVAQGEDNPVLYKREVELIGVNLISKRLNDEAKNKEIEINVMARVRYRQPLFKATLRCDKRQATSDKENWKLVFQNPQKFVAQGQSAVFYLPANLPAEASAKEGALAKEGSKTNEMLGGGIIA